MLIGAWIGSNTQETYLLRIGISALRLRRTEWPNRYSLQRLLAVAIDSFSLQPPRKDTLLNGHLFRLLAGKVLAKAAAQSLFSPLSRRATYVVQLYSKTSGLDRADSATIPDC